MITCHNRVWTGNHRRSTIALRDSGDEPTSPTSTSPTILRHPAVRPISCRTLARSRTRSSRRSPALRARRIEEYRLESERGTTFTHPRNFLFEDEQNITSSNTSPGTGGNNNC